MDLEAAAHGLARLGVPIVGSRRNIRAAIAALPRGEITETVVLRRALPGPLFNGCNESDREPQQVD